MSVDRVAVIGGTGAEGSGLAMRWAAAGIDVVIGSRDEDRAEAAAAKLGAAAGGRNEDAAASARVVVVTVPFAGQAGIYKSIASHVRDDAVVVDCTVPVATAVGGKATHVLGVWEGSAAEQAAALLPEGPKLCAAFHSVSASALHEVSTELDADVLVCGPRAAKPVVRDLVDAIPGLRYVDAGPLANARLVEPITSLLVGINIRYKTDRSGIRITGLPG